MKGKGWLAAVIMAAVLTFSIACAETALTLPEAGLRLKTPEDWQAITAETADQYADALAALGTSPEVVRADLQASGALALWYAPDLEVRLVNLGQAAVDSVWTAGEEEKAALLAQLQAAYSGTELAPKAVVLQCGELFADAACSEADPSFHNVLLLQSKYDEFNYFRDYEDIVSDELINSELRCEFLG